MLDSILEQSKILYNFDKLPILTKRINTKKVLYNSDNISDIKYNFNDYGYRASFDYAPLIEYNKIICIGCSFTEGVGLEEDETWPYILSKKLNINYLNLGLAGGSDGYVVWQIMNVLNNLKNYDIYVLIPPHSRSFFLNDESFNNISYSGMMTSKVSFYRLFDYQRFILLNICKQNNVKYIEWDKFGRNFTKAKDNQHFGVDYQLKIVNEFLKF